MSQHLLIKSFTPQSGSAQELTSINVWLGPANCGKSESLRDLVRLVGNSEPGGVERTKGEEPKTVVLQDVALVPKLTLDRLLQGITRFDSGTGEGTVLQGLGPDLRTPCRRSMAADWKSILFRPTLTARSIWATSLGDLMPLRVAYLPARGIEGLVDAAPAVSPLRAPDHLLAALHDADPAVVTRFEEAMQWILEGLVVRLDASERVQLCLRSGIRPPVLSGNRVQDALAYRSLRPLQEEGDAARRCAAIVLALLLCPGRLLLLDQPDAGLPAETSRRLGAWLAEAASGWGCQVVIAGCDGSFLSGLFQGSSDVSIWRMARRGKDTRFDAVPSEVGRALALFPLFATQQALGCLYCQGVVVTATSGERVVYQAVAERLLRVHNLGYLVAQGGRNLALVAKALRRAEMPTCVVAELDLLQAEGTFVELVKSLSGAVPPAGWLTTRDRLAKHLADEGSRGEPGLQHRADESLLEAWKLEQPSQTLISSSRSETVPGGGWERLRRERLAILPPDLRGAVEEMLEDLKKIGLFLSPKGRLEGWIAFTADAEDPGGWLNRAMQMIHAGESPAELRGFVAELAAHATALGMAR